MVPPEERKGSKWAFKVPVVLWACFKTLNKEMVRVHHCLNRQVRLSSAAGKTAVVTYSSYMEQIDSKALPWAP